MQHRNLFIARRVYRCDLLPDSCSSPDLTAPPIAPQYLPTKSVPRLRDRARIIVQLVQTQTGSAIWPETYDRAVDDLFALQSQLATDVAGAGDEQVAHARQHLAARRERNLMGTMLRDHHHRSTRYRSLWIEAKNDLRVREGVRSGVYDGVRENLPEDAREIEA